MQETRNTGWIPGSGRSPGEENNSGITIIRNIAAEYFLNINDYFNLLIFGVICYAPIVTRTI